MAATPFWDNAGVFGVAPLVVAVALGATAERASVDRPDDVLGEQVHLVYVVPSDGGDRALDTNGVLAASFAVAQTWLSGQTGGARLRLDTFRGEPDVTFVRVPRTDAQLAARGAFVRDELEAILDGLGFTAPKKVYAVYYDGTTTFSCGGGAWPPVLPGRVAAMYLRGAPPGAPPCASSPLPGPPGYFEWGMLHELFHTLGFVASCAPRHTRAGHVSEPANDLMYAGDAPWQLPPSLDVGRNDYYGHGDAYCADLARSAFLTSNAPTPPQLSLVSARAGPARRGRTLEARVELLADGVRPARGRTRCTAATGRRALRTLSAQFADGRALCRWRVPAIVRRGTTVRATVAAEVGGSTLRRTFSKRVI